MSTFSGLHPDTLLARLREHATAMPEREAFRTMSGESWTLGSWWRDATRVAAALVGAGVQPGDRVAILAPNRAMWPIADVGILLAGAVSVGVYPTAAPAQVQEVLSDSGAVVAFADGREQLDKLLAVRSALPALRTVVSDANGPALVGWPDWLARGAAALGDLQRATAIGARAAAVTPSTPAVLIYTSGSTGRAKGARLSHRALLASADSVARTLALTTGDRTLSFLPYSHAGERIFGHCTRMLTGMSAMLVPDATRVWEAARESSPTLFGGMPRFFEKAADALRTAARDASPEDAVRWSRAEQLGRERSALRQAGRPVPRETESAWREAVAVADPVIHAHFGRALRLATSGGASLSSEIASLLDAFGVSVLGAYGQTEHLCGTMHRPDSYGFDSVGLPMPGTELRIAEDGEILFRRSALTFDAYHELPAETQAAFTADGQWLFSGDLGELLADGRLRVTGRKKELIALSTGKKVAPLPIESALEAEPFVAQAVCVGEGRKYLAALLTLRQTAAADWARTHGGAPTDAAAAPDVLAAVEAAVARVNERLSRSEQVKRWRLLPAEFSLERGELTPTQKVRRAEVARLHRSTIDALYDTP